MKTSVDISEVYRLYVEEEMTVREVAKEIGSSKSTVQKIVQINGWSRKNIQRRDKHGRLVAKGQTLPEPNQYGENNPYWKGGISEGYYKRIAFENHLNECFHCKVTDDLEVHHIDRNRLNNEVENLRIVCVKCHIFIEHEDRQNSRDDLGRYKKMEELE